MLRITFFPYAPVFLVNLCQVISPEILILRVASQMVKNLPEMWETRVQSLGREDPLEKEMATHSRILA